MTIKAVYAISVGKGFDVFYCLLKKVHAVVIVELHPFLLRSRLNCYCRKIKEAQRRIISVEDMNYSIAAQFLL